MVFRVLLASDQLSNSPSSPEFPDPRIKRLEPSSLLTRFDSFETAQEYAKNSLSKMPIGSMVILRTTKVQGRYITHIRGPYSAKDYKDKNAILLKDILDLNSLPSEEQGPRSFGLVRTQNGFKRLGPTELNPQSGLRK
jgi:hypothetical protein